MLQFKFHKLLLQALQNILASAGLSADDRFLVACQLLTRFCYPRS